jgi:hypothetical protein
MHARVSSNHVLILNFRSMYFAWFCCLLDSRIKLHRHLVISELIINMQLDQRRLDSVDEMRVLAAGRHRHATARPAASLRRAHIMATWQAVTRRRRWVAAIGSWTSEDTLTYYHKWHGGGLTATMCIDTTPIDALYSYRKVYVLLADYFFVIGSMFDRYKYSILLNIYFLDILFFPRLYIDLTLVYLPIVLTLNIVYYSEQ